MLKNFVLQEQLVPLLELPLLLDQLPVLKVNTVQQVHQPPKTVQQEHGPITWIYLTPLSVQNAPPDIHVQPDQHLLIGLFAQ